MSHSEPVSIAIVGCGRIGTRHAEHVRRLGRLAAVCDVVPAKARTLAAGETPSYESIEAMLAAEKHLDVVAICSPNGLHAEQTILALEAGCDVVCEKPMALSVADADRMLATADRTGRRLFVVKQNRFNPPVAAVKAAIDAGRLGRLLSLHFNCYWNRDADYYRDSWRGTLALDGGTLFTQFSHFVDLMLWIGGDVRSVEARIGNYRHQGVIEFEDTGAAIFEFASGALGSLHYTVNAHSKNMEGSFTLFCEKGTVKVGGQYLNELDYQDIADFRIDGLPAGRPANDYGKYQGSMSNHDKVYENVIAVLRDGAKIATDGREGIKTVDLIERVYRAARG